MRQWVLGIFSASLLSALALALCPEGRVKPVLRMVCGIVCALAVASPLMTLDPESLAAGLAGYRQTGRSLAGDAQEEGKILERTYIERECAAYICDAAAQRDIVTGDVTVEARWNDEALLWVPYSVRLEGAYSAQLSALIERELGIPAERQAWDTDD